MTKAIACSFVDVRAIFLSRQHAIIASPFGVLINYQIWIMQSHFTRSQRVLKSPKTCGNNSMESIWVRPYHCSIILKCLRTFPRHHEDFHMLNSILQYKKALTSLNLSLLKCSFHWISLNYSSSSTIYLSTLAYTVCCSESSKKYCDFVPVVNCSLLQEKSNMKSGFSSLIQVEKSSEVFTRISSIEADKQSLGHLILIYFYWTAVAAADDMVHAEESIFREWKSAGIRGCGNSMGVGRSCGSFWYRRGALRGEGKEFYHLPQQNQGENWESSFRITKRQISHVHFFSCSLPDSLIHSPLKPSLNSILNLTSTSPRPTSTSPQSTSTSNPSLHSFKLLSSDCCHVIFIPFSPSNHSSAFSICLTCSCQPLVISLPFHSTLLQKSCSDIFYSLSFPVAVCKER
ncbi:hypothetical protein VP01_5250g1 [Puccinia sorghi]|uniref:Uncharacterized protein n=1 Tax=Puccinia sorghi TaxID=27349 RepID=A0A0L6UKI2_9BASI|nr:hypothetical protein VP01_5250g1 [Puccinia sorghi]